MIQTCTQVRNVNGTLRTCGVPLSAAEEHLGRCPSCRSGWRTNSNFPDGPGQRINEGVVVSDLHQTSRMRLFQLGRQQRLRRRALAKL